MSLSGRQGIATTLKVTNNLLASVLILTVIPPDTGFSEAALEYCCSLISKKLLERDVCFPYLVVASGLIVSSQGFLNRCTLHENDRTCRLYRKHLTTPLHQAIASWHDRIPCLHRIKRRSEGSLKGTRRNSQGILVLLRFSAGAIA